MAGYIIKYKDKKYINFDGYREHNNLDAKTAMARMVSNNRHLCIFDSIFYCLDEDFKNTCKFPVQDFDKELSKFTKLSEEEVIKTRSVIIGKNDRRELLYILGSFLLYPFKEIRYNDKYNKIKYFPILKVEGALYVVLRVRNKNNSKKSIVCDIEN